VADVVLIALGSNLGDRRAYLTAARNAIALRGDVRLLACSDIEETAPIGGMAQPPFLNQMIAVATTLDPSALLNLAHRIEQSLGRIRTRRWAPRTIDIDIVRFGDRTVHEPALTIPHPGIADRDFWQREITQLDQALGQLQ
jgi:2-amino-4-hydroxy-6-hydroxymethyldihydropteridine diphosphokinase